VSGIYALVISTKVIDGKPFSDHADEMFIGPSMSARHPARSIYATSYLEQAVCVLVFGAQPLPATVLHLFDGSVKPRFVTE